MSAAAKHTRTATPSPAPRRRVPLGRTRPAIRVQVHKQIPASTSSVLPSPAASNFSSPSTSFNSHTPPCTAPAAQYIFPNLHTPGTPSPLRPRTRHLGHLPTPSNSSFASSLASSSRLPAAPSTATTTSSHISSRSHHRRSRSLAFVPTPVRPTLAMSITLPQPVPVTRRPSHSRSPSADYFELPVRPPSRSERLLRETLARDTQRARGRRADSYSSSPTHLPDMFDCCVDDEIECQLQSKRRPNLLRSVSRSPDDVAVAERTRAWVEVRGRPRASSEYPLSKPSVSQSPRAPPSPALSSVSLGLSRRPSTSGRPRHHTHPSATTTNGGVSPRAAYTSLSALQAVSTAVPPSPRSVALPRSPSRARPSTSSDNSSDSSPVSTPQTPPAAPVPFDAHVASAKLRETAGYVSFAAVEGLGVPPDDEAESSEERRGWFRLWGRT